MWLCVLEMMFLFSKYTKSNVFLICVPKSKTTNNLKRREYYEIFGIFLHVLRVIYKNKCSSDILAKYVDYK